MSINMRQAAFVTNIIHVLREIFHEWHSPSTPSFWVIYPSFIANFTKHRTFISYRTKIIHLQQRIILF